MDLGSPGFQPRRAGLPGRLALHKLIFENNCFALKEMAWCHLLVDLYGCNVDSLNNKELLEKALRDLSDIMGLRIILGPILVHYAGKEGSPSGEGYSGFVVVAESHVSIHTDIRTGYASIDVYSCKEFDVQRIEEYLSRVFEPAEIEKQLILRGLMLEKAGSTAAGRA